jgi:6-pyruvoyltetrahydropterin/6-carboxytetrahydropterin synthase
MYHLKILSNFAAAHNLLHYHGDCENLHGPNWKVEVTVATSDLDASGLGIDFKTLKRHTKEILARLDHKYLNELEFFKGVSPSSEHISRYIFDALESSLKAPGVVLEQVTVWESDKACATYTRD